MAQKILDQTDPNFIGPKDSKEESKEPEKREFYTLEFQKDSRRTLNNAKKINSAEYIVEKLSTKKVAKNWQISFEFQKEEFSETTRVRRYTLVLTLIPNDLKADNDITFIALEQVAEKIARIHKFILVKANNEELEGVTQY